MTLTTGAHPAPDSVSDVPYAVSLRNLGKRLSAGIIAAKKMPDKKVKNYIFMYLFLPLHLPGSYFFNPSRRCT